MCSAFNLIWSLPENHIKTHTIEEPMSLAFSANKFKTVKCISIIYIRSVSVCAHLVIISIRINCH